jgi:lipopolysaccharide transport system ATP-binding protein
MNPIIEIKGVGKKYNINHHRGGYIALRDVIADTFRHPIVFLKKKTKEIVGIDTKEEFWALKDINLSIKKGEIVGIVGHNGAGKSTLLKILTKITPPEEGEIVMRGSIASLLEVGTGFHPELSGRENIFLNGAILGMTKKEIARKFDEIVEFAGVEKFLDTPVKYYSSGMYVRLAFSVAAHMEPDILLVDEVLAVGDAEFQKKCIGKMEEVTRKNGRTIFFVSHNMSAIQSLCSRVILLEHGRIKDDGDPKDVIAKYLKANPLLQNGDQIRDRKDRKGKGEVIITSFHIEQNGKRVGHIESGGRYTFCVGYEAKNGKPIQDVSLALTFLTEAMESLSLNWTKYTKQDFENAPAKGYVRCSIDQKFPFNDGLYIIGAGLTVREEKQDQLNNLGTFEVRGGDFYGTGARYKHSPILLEQSWSIEQRLD